MSEKIGVTVPLVVEPQSDQLLKSNDDVVEDDANHCELSSARGNNNSDEGPTVLGSEAPVAHVAPLLRVEHLKPGGCGSVLDSSFCTSEEEYGSHHEFSDDGDQSGNNSSRSIPSLALNEALVDPPDEELQTKIISLVEYYFSNESILKDAFLLKHVRRNRFGFVSIKLITSFKKMKSLTKDYRVVAYSLKNSEHLELNEECSKVRRKEPLPEYDETVPSRTVIALNLPFENPTMENISDTFSKCGCIANFRILRPGTSIPTDLVKFSSKHPELGTTMCAVVAFETYDQAKKACEILNSDDWRKGMRVVPLMVPKKKEEKSDHISDKDRKEKKKNFDFENDEDVSGEEALGDDKKRRRRGGRKKKTRVDELSHHDSSCYSSGSEGDIPSKPHISPGNKYRSGDHLSPNAHSRGSGTSPKGSPHSRRKGYNKSPLVNSSGVSPRSSPEMVRRGIDSSGGDSAPSSPWVQRRLRVAQEKISAGGSPLGSPLLGRRNLDGSFVPGSAPRMLDMTNVLRQPKGPDGTKGFYGGFGRGKPRSSTIS